MQKCYRFLCSSSLELQFLDFSFTHLFQVRQEPSTHSSSSAAAGMAFMSQDGWKSGLTPVQLTKVEALQTGFERMQKEAAQKKLMVENQEQELERQKRKVSVPGVRSQLHDGS